MTILLFTLSTQVKVYFQLLTMDRNDVFSFKVICLTLIFKKLKFIFF